MNAYVATSILWAVWIVSWWAAALWRDRAVKRPSAIAEMVYRAVIIGGALLLYNFFIPGSSHWMLWTPGPAMQWTMVALVAVGLSFTWWARVSLGRLWSSSITRKADHRVIDTGPYALVRHPIYSGVILAQFATAGQGGSVQAVSGAVIMLMGWYIKARMEEAFLREQLGRDDYDAYARRVPMLVPFLRA